MILNYSYRNYSLDHVNLYIYVCVLQPRATYHSKPKTYFLRGPESAPNPYIYIWWITLFHWTYGNGFYGSAFSRLRPQIGMSIFSINNMLFLGPNLNPGPYRPIPIWPIIIINVTTINYYYYYYHLSYVLFVIIILTISCVVKTRWYIHSIIIYIYCWYPTDFGQYYWLTIVIVIGGNINIPILTIVKLIPTPD